MEIKDIIKELENEKKWISGRLSTIDSLLDRAAYRNSSNEDELNEESDILEKRRAEIQEIFKMIDKVSEIDRIISILELNVDSLACFTGNEIKIEKINDEINELEENKEKIIESIMAKVKPETSKNENIKKR